MIVMEVSRSHAKQVEVIIMRGIPPDIWDWPEIRIRNYLQDSEIGSDAYHLCRTILQMRRTESSIEATNRLVISTNRLVWGTWALVFIGIIGIFIKFFSK